MKDKICPDCKGKGGWPIYDWHKRTCNTCKGKGTIPDKIRKEFEKWQGEQTTHENVEFAKECFPDEKELDRTFIALGFYAGYKSRDKEIKGEIDNFKSCDRERLRLLKEKADIEIYKNKEIKKLRDALEEIREGLIHQNGIRAIRLGETAIKALKDGE